MRRRIDRLIGVIDQLIDEGLAGGERDGDIGHAVCNLCGGDWHGTLADATTAGEYHRTANCPGAFATAEQRVHWLRTHQDPVTLNDYVDALRELGCGALLGADSCEVCGDCPWACALQEHELHCGTAPLPPPLRAPRTRRTRRPICVLIDLW